MAGPSGGGLARPPARKAARGARERLPLSGGPGGGKTGGARKLRAQGKSALRSCARLFSIMLLMLIHAGLLLWASLMVVGVRHKVSPTGRPFCPPARLPARPLPSAPWPRCRPLALPVRPARRSPPRPA